MTLNERRSKLSTQKLHASYGRPAAVLIFISFVRRLILDVSWPAITKPCHMFDGDQIYKCRSAIWEFKEFIGPKTSKFLWAFEQIRDLIVNVSGA